MEQILERKIVSISPKRQITIPQKFFKKLGFELEAECILRGSEIVIRPTKNISTGAYSEYILEDLLREGYSGDSLLDEFRIRYGQIDNAVKSLIAEADAVAEGKSDYATIEDVFEED